MSVRTYFRKDRPIEIEQVDGVVAVRGVPNGRLISPSPNGFNPQSVDALERAGWILRENTLPTPSPNESAQVFRRGDNLLLGTPRLNVQFTADLAHESAERILAGKGFHVIRKLSFAPGLFQVSVGDSSHGDALDAANQLRQSPDVQWAEPEFVEVLSYRLLPPNPHLPSRPCHPSRAAVKTARIPSARPHPQPTPKVPAALTP